MKPMVRIRECSICGGIEWILKKPNIKRETPTTTGKNEIERSQKQKSKMMNQKEEEKNHV